MKKIKNLLNIIIIVSFFSMLFNPIFVNAASASISASKTTAYVGDKVTITVKIKAGSWNLKVSGSGISNSIVGYDMDANKSTTKTYTLNTSKAGTYKVSLTGDITDYDTEATSNISKSVTVVVKTKPKTDTKTQTKTDTKTQTQTKTDTKTQTQTKTDTKPKPKKEVVSEITKFEVVGYDLEFNKDKIDYEIEINENVKKLYIIVEGKNITVEGNKEVSIVDKNEVKVKIKETKETKEYTIKLKKISNVKEEEKEKIEENPITSSDDKDSNNSNNSNIFLITTILLVFIVLGETLFIIKNRK